MSESAFDWTCAHCGLRQVGTEENAYTNYARLPIGITKHSQIGSVVHAIRCLNEDCNDFTLVINIHKYEHNHYSVIESMKEELFGWRVYPESFHKIQPPCVPDSLAKDYYEACQIRDRSPKASATLSRRCLQGMIRDFCNIKERTLFAEIEQLRKMLDESKEPKGVQAETIEAIHAVRELGNIGAHMSGDVNSICDVDTNEAQSMIDLLEMLFDEWYVARNRREERLAKLISAAGSKRE